MTKRKRQVFTGGPVLHGYWASWLGAIAAGVCLDKIETIDRLTSATGDYAVWWLTDWAWAAAAGALMVFSLLAQNAYGRACWFTWVPDAEQFLGKQITWNTLRYADVRRTPLIRRPRWLMWTG